MTAWVGMCSSSVFSLSLSATLFLCSSVSCANLSSSRKHSCVHSYVWHDSFICVTCLKYSFVLQDSFIHGRTVGSCIWDMTCSHQKRQEGMRQETKETCPVRSRSRPPCLMIQVSLSLCLFVCLSHETWLVHTRHHICHTFIPHKTPLLIHIAKCRYGGTKSWYHISKKFTHSLWYTAY